MQTPFSLQRVFGPYSTYWTLVQASLVFSIQTRAIRGYRCSFFPIILQSIRHASGKTDNSTFLHEREVSFSKGQQNNKNMPSNRFHTVCACQWFPGRVLAQNVITSTSMCTQGFRDLENITLRDLKAIETNLHIPLWQLNCACEIRIYDIHRKAIYDIHRKAK